MSAIELIFCFNCFPQIRGEVAHLTYICISFHADIYIFNQVVCLFEL